MSDDLRIFPDDFVPNVQASDAYKRWAKSSPGDRARWEAFRDALLADPAMAVVPSMSTRFGKALVAAGREHMTISALVGQVTNPYPQQPVPVVFDKYAARNGSDSNPGTFEQPYLTANKLFNSLLPGQRGALRAGIYNDAVSGDARRVISMTTAGSTSQVDGISVFAYPGESVEIRGSTYIARHWLRMENIKVNSRPLNDARDEVWWVIGNDHYYYNCEFTQNAYDDQTQYVSKGSATFVNGARTSFNHCIFRDVLWDNVGNQPHGIYCSGANLSVTKCKFWNIGYRPSGAARSSQYGLQFWPSASGGLVQNCIFDYCNSAVALGTVTGIVFERNIITNTSSVQAGIWVGGGSDTLVRDNHTHSLGDGWIYETGGTVTESGTTTGDPLYTNAAGHVYHPFTGEGTTGKGTDW